MNRKKLLLVLFSLLAVSLFLTISFIINSHQISQRILTSNYIKSVASKVDLSFVDVDTLPNSQVETWRLDMEPAKGVVFFFANYNQTKEHLWPEAMHIYRMGYSVVLVDHYSTDTHPPKVIAYSQADIIKEAYQIETQNNSLTPIYFYGFSTGANAIIYALFKYKLSPTGVILQSPFLNMDQIIKNIEPGHLNLTNTTAAHLLLFEANINAPLSFTLMAQEIKVPVLHIHGQDDEAIGWSQNQKMYNSYAGLKEMGVFEHGKHKSLLPENEPNWNYLLTNFFHICTKAEL